MKGFCDLCPGAQGVAVERMQEWWAAQVNQTSEPMRRQVAYLDGFAAALAAWESEKRAEMQEPN